MTAVTRNLAMEQGATYRLSFRWLIPDPDFPTDPEQATPVDLTGFKVRMQIRQNVGSPVLLTATTETGEFSVVGAAGRIYLRLSPAQTNSLTLRSSKYDIEVESPDGDVYRLMEGTVTLSPNITQVVGSEVTPGA